MFGDQTAINSPHHQPSHLNNFGHGCNNSGLKAEDDIKKETEFDTPDLDRPGFKNLAMLNGEIPKRLYRVS